VTGGRRKPFTRDGSLGYQVNHAARLFAQALHQRIAPLGVVPGQFAQLLALFEADGQTQRQLCEQVGIEQPTMANTLRRMERDGLIRREPDPTDGRQARVLLTQRARDLERPLITAARAVNATAIRGLDAQDVATVLAALTQVIDNLEEDAANT
jgi:DNA-binding MarR family transcriptional regulator